jgi:hypothetical protein
MRRLAPETTAPAGLSKYVPAFWKEKVPQVCISKQRPKAREIGGRGGPGGGGGNQLVISEPNSVAVMGPRIASPQGSRQAHGDGWILQSAQKHGRTV